MRAESSGLQREKRETEPDILPDRPPSARLVAVINLALRLAWDRLGTIIAVSLTWALLLSISLASISLIPHSIPTAVRTGVGLFFGIVVISVLTVGVFYVAHLICSSDEVSYADLWHGAGRFWGVAVKLGLIHLAVLTVLCANFWFYIQLRSSLGAIAAVVCGYVALLWLMMSVYHVPLLIAQETGVFDEPERIAHRGVLAVLRRAFFLALGRPIFTLGLLLAALVLSGVCTGLVVLIPLVLPGSMAVLTVQATRMLLIEYGVLPPPRVGEIIPDEKFRIKG